MIVVNHNIAEIVVGAGARASVEVSSPLEMKPQQTLALHIKVIAHVFAGFLQVVTLNKMRARLP
jgi:hypothetical protein